MRGIRVIFTVCALALAVSPPMSWAQSAATSQAGTMTPDQAQQTVEGKFVQDLGNKAIVVIADKSLGDAQRKSKYSELLNQAFDMPTIGRFVIGRVWATMTPDQQQQYMKLFQSLMVKIYGDRLNFYSGESFKVKSVRHESDKDAVVSSDIIHPGTTTPTTVDWRVRTNNGKPLIVDVVVDGVSQSVTQHQEYASIIQRDGGKVDGLLAMMQQRLQGGSSGQ